MPLPVIPLPLPLRVLLAIKLQPLKPPLHPNMFLSLDERVAIIAHQQVALLYALVGLHFGFLVQLQLLLDHVPLLLTHMRPAYLLVALDVLELEHPRLVFGVQLGQFLLPHWVVAVFLGEVV
jgi:hypothetical protein